MTQQHKDSLHKAVHAHMHHRKRIAEEAIQLAKELAAQQPGDVAVHPEGDTQGKEKASNA